MSLCSQQCLHRLSRFLPCLLLFLFLASAPSRSAYGASIFVNTTADEDNNDGDCSLREAILAAANDAARDSCSPGSGYDYIVVPDGTYYLSSPINLYGDMSITGVGSPWTLIDGMGATQMFHRSGPAAELTLKDLTLRNGHALSDGFGSCFYQSGGYTSTFQSVHFYNCTSSGRGGAIYNAGDLTIEDSVLEYNSATGHVSGNNSGGAIYMTGGSLSITRTTFANNDTELSGPDGSGGAIEASGDLTVSDSTFSGNQGRYGGAIAVWGTVHIHNSLFANNTSIYGGALSVGGSGAILEVENSTFSGNTGVALQNGVDAWVVQSTFFGNTTGPTLVNTGNLTLKGTILMRSDGDNCVTSMTSAGYNIENTDSCGLGGTGDLVNTDPLLEPLADYGGPTETHKPLANSPAVDGGDPAGCTDSSGAPLLVDQRGLPRPVDGDLDGVARCDIGAVERELSVQYLPLIQR